MSTKTRVLRILLVPVLIGLGLVWLFVQSAQAEGRIDAFDGIAKEPLLNLFDFGMMPGSGNLRLLQADDKGMTLELYISGFDIKEDIAEGEPCQLVHVDGLASSGKPGWPRMPKQAALLGLPPDGEPILNVVETELVEAPGQYNLCPELQPDVEQELTGEVRYLGQVAVRDREVYAQNQFLPAEIAEIGLSGYLRSQRIAQVVMRPFQYNAATGQLRYFRRIQVRLSFAEETLRSERIQTVPVDEGPFENLLRNTLMNYETARNWRVPSPNLILNEAQTRTLTAPGVPTADYEFKLLINEDGIYKVSYDDLIAAGAVLASVDPATLQLFHADQEVAIRMVDNGDDIFETGEYFLFYGQQVDTKYTDTNVYFLTWGATEGRRMSELDGTVGGAGSVTTEYQDSVHVESNYSYQSARPSGPDNDTWYWGFVHATSGPVSMVYQFDLENVHIGSGQAQARWLFKSYAAIPHHHTRVYLNEEENLLADFTWSPMAEYTGDVTIPQDYLIEGTNTFTVEVPYDEVYSITRDTILVNWFEVNYWDDLVAEGNLLFFNGDANDTLEYRISGFTVNDPELFDITEPYTPVVVPTYTMTFDDPYWELSFDHTIDGEHRYVALSQANYLAPAGIVEDQASNLRDISNGAEYIIITHADFYTDVLPLAAHRSGQGLSTMVVDVEDVYDEFNHGVMDPLAIRNFLAYAYENWEGDTPAYVLLVGDGHFDPRDYVNSIEPIFIPPYLEQVDPWLGETAGDNRFVTIVGDDTVPDMYLGRIPVRTAAETAAVVDKILGYEADVISWDEWKGRVLFVADDPDGAGPFDVLSDHVADNPNYLPSRYERIKVYDQVTHFDPALARSDILAAINEGVVIVNYIGHGNRQFWGDARYLSFDSIALLTNGDTLPFFVPMTCLEGVYTYLNFPTQDNSALAEKLLRAEGKGSIAGFSPTGLGVATGHDYLNRGLYDAIFAQGMNELGMATTQAKIFMANNTEDNLDLLDTYLLFGDPALRLREYLLPIYIPLVSQD